MIESIQKTTTVDDFQNEVVDNKKALWGERIGECSFAGAGGKCICLNTGNGKEFVKYSDAFDGKGKYGKLLHNFFFGGEEDNLTVVDILNLIDENLNASDIALLKQSLFESDSRLKLQIGDIFGGVGLTTAIDVQKEYDEFSEELKSAEKDDKLLANEILDNHKELVIAEAICRHFNREFEFMNYDFELNAVTGETNNVHFIKFQKDDRPFIRRLANEGFVMYSTYDVDALAKVVDLANGERRLELRLLC